MLCLVLIGKPWLATLQRTALNATSNTELFQYHHTLRLVTELYPYLQQSLWSIDVLPDLPFYLSVSLSPFYDSVSLHPSSSLLFHPSPNLSLSHLWPRCFQMLKFTWGKLRYYRLPMIDNIVDISCGYLILLYVLISLIYVLWTMSLIHCYSIYLYDWQRTAA